jgi:hypothetical protein
MLSESDAELVQDFLNLINCRSVDQISIDSHRMWFILSADGTHTHDITRVGNDYVPQDGEILDQVVEVYGTGANFLACAFTGDISITYFDNLLYESILHYLNIVSVDKAIMSGRMLFDYEIMRYFRLRFITHRLQTLDSELAYKMHGHFVSRYKKSFELLDDLMPAMDNATSAVFGVSIDEKERIVRNYLLSHELAHVWRKKHPEMFHLSDDFLREFAPTDFSKRGYSSDRVAFETASDKRAMQYHSREHSRNAQYRDELVSDFFATQYFLSTEYCLFEAGDRVFDSLETLYLAAFDAATKLIELDTLLFQCLRQELIKELPPVEERLNRYRACSLGINAFRLLDKPLLDTKIDFTIENAQKLAAVATEVKHSEIPKALEPSLLAKTFFRKRDRLFFRTTDNFAKECAEIREAVSFCS